MQLLIARNGKIVYNKNYGYHTYEKKQKVDAHTLYDVASLTKILATLPLIMELEEKGVVDLNTRLGDFLPEYAGSNKANISLKANVVTLWSLKSLDTILFEDARDDTKKPKDSLYVSVKKPGFSIKVADNLYLKDSYKDSMYHIIKESPLRKKWKYKYSDLPYYILKQYLEKYYGKGLDQLVQDRFYGPMGLPHTTYNPLTKFSKRQITPSEHDKYYR